MKNLAIYLSAFILSSCAYPYNAKKQLRNIRSEITPLSNDEIKISSYHFSAGQVRGSNRVITDTLEIREMPDSILLLSLQEFGFTSEKLVNDPSLEILIDPKIRWRFGRLTEFLERQSFTDNTLVPIVCYNAGLEPERSGGGGIGPIYNTGNDRYFLIHELLLAFYQNNELIYLKRAVQRNEKIVPAGTPITHEFPQHVLDTLMQMALEPLLEQMEKNASKHQKP